MADADKVILKIILESSEKIDSFTRRWTDLHQFFYDISRDPKYTSLFDDLLFDTNGPFPFCSEIDEILSGIHLSGIIGTPNPVMEAYSINVKKSEVEGSLAGVFPFTDAEEGMIQEITGRFVAQLHE